MIMTPKNKYYHEHFCWNNICFEYFKGTQFISYNVTLFNKISNFTKIDILNKQEMQFIGYFVNKIK